MCEAVDENDSRRPGWYCCRDNRFNKGRTCVACKHKRDKNVTEIVVPRLRRKKRAKGSKVLP
jgi:hypothetical protein